MEESLLENLKIEKINHYGEGKLVLVRDHFKVLRGIFQKAEKKPELIDLIKDEILINHFKNIAYNDIKGSIEKFMKITQKTLQKIEDQLKNQVDVQSLNNNSSIINVNNPQLTNKKSNNKLDENSQNIFNTKIKLFEENFLSKHDDENAKLLENLSILKKSIPFSQKNENQINDVINKVIIDPNSSSFEEKFKIFFFENIKNNPENINFSSFFTAYLQRSFSEIEKKAKEAISILNSENVGIFFQTVAKKIESINLKNMKKGLNLENNLIMICVILSSKKKIFYSFKNKITKDQKDSDKIFLNFITVSKIKNDLKFYETYLKEFIKESENFDFYLDLNLIIKSNFHLDFIDVFKNEYLLKDSTRNFDEFKLEEISDSNSLNKLMNDIKICKFYTNDLDLLKVLFEYYSLPLNEIQIN